MKHRTFIAREQYKVSCAHMTVFPDGTKERLHGHNYSLALALDLDRIDLSAMVPFSPLKQALGDLCAAWKERVLLAAHNPFFKIAREDDLEIEFHLCGDRYVLPKSDVLLVPCDNISVEALAVLVAARLRGTIVQLSPHILGFEVTMGRAPWSGSDLYRLAAVTDGTCAPDLRRA